MIFRGKKMQFSETGFCLFCSATKI